MATLRLNNIHKYYGETHVVKGISTEIKDKEFLVLVGPSGCGKSTILRMIAGLENISSGELFIENKLVNDVPPGKRGVAMVFQDYALYPHMNVYENMAFGLSLNKKISKEEIERRINEASEMLDLGPYLKRKPAALSGGQRQRVAMGRALVKKSSVFLFDEPLSNLDAKLRSKMRAEIKKFHIMTKATVVYVTHDQLEAMTLADRIAVMNGGVVEQMGTPLEIFNHPRTVFVAGFIGNPTMNIMEMNVVERDKKKYIVTDDGKFELPLHESKLAILGSRKKVVMGLRPHDIWVVLEGKKLCKARVEIVELLGKSAYLTVIAGNKELMIEMIGDDFPKIGDMIGLDFSLEHVHLFDPETGMNLNIK